MQLKSNGHNGHQHNGHAARHGRAGHCAGRLAEKSCPKCYGFVLDRYDPYLGWEAYCINCGWTPLTSLETHVIPAEDLHQLARLRRWGKRWVSFNLCVSKGESD